jgi:hypothetical protein
MLDETVNPAGSASVSTLMTRSWSALLVPQAERRLHARIARIVDRRNGIYVNSLEGPDHGGIATM